MRIRRADDVLAAYKREGAEAGGDAAIGKLLEGEPLVLAKFAVKFRDSKRERVVTVIPPNRAKYTQDRDGHSVTAWLRDAKFVLTRQEPETSDE